MCGFVLDHPTIFQFDKPIGKLKIAHKFEWFWRLHRKLLCGYTHSIEVKSFTLTKIWIKNEAKICRHLFWFENEHYFHYLFRSNNIKRWISYHTQEKLLQPTFVVCGFFDLESRKSCSYNWNAAKYIINQQFALKIILFGRIFFPNQKSRKQQILACVYKIKKLKQ